MEDNDTYIIKEKSLQLIPFLLYYRDTKLPIESIYVDSFKYNVGLNNFQINSYIFSISFRKINQYKCKMFFYSKRGFEFSCTLLYEPIFLDLKDLQLNMQSIYLYSDWQLSKIIKKYKLYYQFVDESGTILDENNNCESLKKVTVYKKKIYDVDKEIYSKLLEKYFKFLEFIESNKKIEMIDIDPLLLSFNFHHIFKNNSYKEKEFKLILNEERNKFIKSIKDFVNSEKEYLWILGSDGIGKTISFMYYTLISDCNVLYLNLKLFNENNPDANENFVNDIIKYFYLKKNNIDSNSLINLKNELIYIFKYVIFISQSNNKKLTAKDFWTHLKNLFDYLYYISSQNSIIIILDQYRDLSIDSDHENLNKFFNFVHQKNCKVIISCSVNNYSIQSSFFSNIQNMTFNSDYEGQNLDELDDSDGNNIKDIYEINQECEKYEKILNKATIKGIKNGNDITITPDNSFLILNQSLKDYTLKIYYPFLVSGKELSLDFNEEEIKCFKNFNFNLKYINKYISFKDEYIKKSSLQYGNEKKNIDIQTVNNNFYENINSQNENMNNINEKNNEEKEKSKIEKINIVENVIDEENNEKKEKIKTENKNAPKNDINDKNNEEKEKTIIQNINNAENDIHLKNNEEKEKTKNENNVLDIIKEFYETCNAQIISKIEEFYSRIGINEQIKSIALNEYENLKELRDVIFNGDLFNISDLRTKMKSFPGKYLNIRNQSTLPLNPFWNKNIKNFQIEYANTFCNLAMNNLLKRLDAERDYTYHYMKGAGAGINFEAKVIYTILTSHQPILGRLEYNKRRVFSLVGKTDNSKKTVELYRNEEKNNLLYTFYDINEYSEVIDDIDFPEGSEKIKLSKNLYLIVQVSKTGRSFDFAILEKIPNSQDWYLYIFQATIKKTSELKEKRTYIYDSVQCDSYLSHLYGINIKKKFFLFVLPFNSCDISFINELEKKNIPYIFFGSNQFKDQSGNIICHMNFPKADITDQTSLNTDFYQVKIEKTIDAFNESTDQYLRRKRKNKTLSSFFAKNLSYINGRGIKLNLSNEIKNQIINTIIKNKDLNGKEYELLFIGNCKFKSIEEVHKKNRAIVFFLLQNNYYFYYGNYYKYENGDFVKITFNFDLKSLKLINHNYGKVHSINLADIIPNSNLCFCHTIIDICCPYLLSKYNWINYHLLY